ncbi:MAG TPA: fumarylacetoacetate hydrolase family protein [Burkholderiales bacterium]
MRKCVGRKIGFTNRGIWQKYGVHQPMWGTVYDDTLILAEGGSARVPLQGLFHPRIEPEICFKLAAPPLTDDPAQLLGAIEWVAHSIEIVQCRNADWKVTLADCAAQNGLHGRLIVGNPLKISAGLDAKLPAIKVMLMKNGVEVDRGTGANVLDSPLLALAHLVRVLAKERGAPPLAAGEIVSTGTMTDAHPVAPGETWRTELAGLPLAGLELRFA